MIDVGECLPGEEWRDIPGYAGRYQASSAGRIRSFCKTVPRVLRPCVDRNGRPMVYPSLAGMQRGVLVHALVAAAFIGPRPKGAQIDHIDCDRSNNSAANLRYCTQSQNQANSRGRRNRTGFKGVFLDTTQGGYRAAIGFNRKLIQLGRFKDAVAAVHAYDAKAAELFGEFARLNFAATRAKKPATGEL